MSNVIVVKIGTESLVDFENSEKVQKLIDAVVDKIREGIMVILVTSGAVDFGRKTLRVQKTPGENKALLAAIGWDSLMGAYRKKFNKEGLNAAGFLVTHADIEDKNDRRDAFRKVIESAWESGIIPIVNENDALSAEELEALKRGADNDKNAFLLARIFQAKQLVFITNTNGVYKNKDDPNTRIASMRHDLFDPSTIDLICSKSAKSDTGTGGMASKLYIAHEAGFIGMDTHIGDGIISGLHDLYSGGTNIFDSSNVSHFQN